MADDHHILALDGGAIGALIRRRRAEFLPRLPGEDVPEWVSPKAEPKPPRERKIDTRPIGQEKGISDFQREVLIQLVAELQAEHADDVERLTTQLRNQKARLAKQQAELAELRLASERERSAKTIDAQPAVTRVTLN
jgi:hypothetical protein